MVSGFLERDNHDAVFASKHFIHHAPHSMQVFIRDLHEDAAGVGEQFAAKGGPVTQVAQVTMHAQRPGVAVGLDRFRLACQVGFIVFHVAPTNFRLEIRGELDAVGRVAVDHLDLGGQALAHRARLALTCNESPRNIRLAQSTSCSLNWTAF